MHEFDARLRNQMREVIEGITSLIQQGDHASVATMLAEIPADTPLPVKLGALRVSQITRDQYLEAWTALRDQVQTEVGQFDTTIAERIMAGLADV